MEENTNPEAKSEPDVPVCGSCQNPDVVPGHPMLLCSNCRAYFIKYPIPLWVKLFGAGVGVVLIISLIWLPRNMGAAIALSRAEKAEKELNFLTSQQELEKAKKVAPKSIEVLGHLMIASFNNEDFNTLFDALKAMGDKSVEDTALYNQLSYIMSEARYYTPSDAFAKEFASYQNRPVPDSAYRRFIKQQPSDINAMLSLANLYVQQNNYRPADTLLSRVMVIDNEFIPAINLKSKVKREIGQPDSSIYYCNKLLAMNHQSLYGLSAKARTLLKTGKLENGTQLAKQCYELSHTEPYNLATLTIAYHLSKNYKQRDEIINSAPKDSATVYYMQYAKDVVSNKIKF